MPEHVIAHYEILEHLGDGGMGVIYKARDTRLDRIVALKFLPPHLMGQDDANQRFMLEAQTASSLNHPNVCTIHEIGKAEDGRQFIAMAYYDGETLRQRLEGGKIDRDQALRIAGQIAEGLASAHEKEIVHRDIKPENIMITARGHAVILDFGIAKLVNQTGITRAGFTVGTAGYMSPEQSVGSSTTPKTDVWSLGVLLYEMLMGEQPFAAEYEQAVIYNILNSEPRDPHGLRVKCGDSIADLVEACLSKDPDDRPDSSTVAEILSEFAVGATATRRHGHERHRKSVGRKGLVWAGIAVGIVVLALASNWLFRSANRDAEGPVAIFAEDVSADSVVHVASAGFLQALTKEAVRSSQEGVLPRLVIPAAELFRFGAKNGVLADSVFGVHEIVTVRLEQTENRLYRMSMVLRKAKSWAPIDSVVGAFTNLRRAHDRGLEALGRFMDADGEVLSSIPTDLETSRFEDYVMVLGLIEHRDPAALERAKALRDLIVVSTVSFPQIYGALADAYWFRFEQTRDTTFISELLQAAEARDARQSPEFLTVLAEAYLSINQPVAAAERFKEALDIDPTYIRALQEWTRLAGRTGRYAETDSLHRRIVAIEPDYWLGHMRYGQFLYDRGRYEDAAKQFEFVVKQAPGLTWGYSGVGAALWQLKDQEGARSAFERAPTRDFLINSNLGTLSFYLNQYADAVRYYEEALAMNPESEEVLANLAAVYDVLPNEKENSKTSVQAALARAEPLLAEQPDDLSLRARIANYYSMLDDTAEALAYLKPFMRAPWDRVNGQTAFSVAAAWEEIGERDRALVWIRAALERKYARHAIDNYFAIDSLRADPRYIAMVDSMSQ